MTLQEKAAKTIRKLLSLTQDNCIEWEGIYSTGCITRSTNYKVDTAYKVAFDDYIFLLYEASYETMDEDGRVSWDSRVNIELVDEVSGDEYVPIWLLPRIPAAWDLLEAVKIKAGRVEERLDYFLSEDG